MGTERGACRGEMGAMGQNDERRGEYTCFFGDYGCIHRGGMRNVVIAAVLLSVISAAWGIWWIRFCLRRGPRGIPLTIHSISTMGRTWKTSSILGMLFGCYGPNANRLRMSLVTNGAAIRAKLMMHMGVAFAFVLEGYTRLRNISWFVYLYPLAFFLYTQFVLKKSSAKVDSDDVHPESPEQRLLELLLWLFLCLYPPWVLLSSAWVANHIRLRILVRERFHIPRNYCFDCLLACFCAPCSLGQLAVQLDDEEGGFP